MKIYIVMVDDRHTDVDAFPFTTPEAAIDDARERAHAYARGGVTVEEHDTLGWLYHATYSSEGDAVWVMEKDLDGAAVKA